MDPLVARLQLVLRILSVIVMTAVFAAMLPMETMKLIHRQIGLGEMPESPIVEYLARSVSLFYAFHGAMIWYLASDLRRNLRFFRFYLRLSLVFAAGLFLVDLSAGLPWRWVLFEGPPAMLLIAVLLMGLRRVPKAEPEKAA